MIDDRHRFSPVCSWKGPRETDAVEHGYTCNKLVSSEMAIGDSVLQVAYDLLDRVSYIRYALHVRTVD